MTVQELHDEVAAPPEVEPRVVVPYGEWSVEIRTPDGQVLEVELAMWNHDRSALTLWAV